MKFSSARTAFATLAIVLCAPPAFSAADNAKNFDIRHHCRVIALMRELVQRKGRDRYVIVEWPRVDATAPGGYVQCLFEDDNSAVLCEAASPYYQKELKLSESGRKALAAAGFATEVEKGNFRREIKVVNAETLDRVATFMLRSLYQGYDGTLNRPVNVFGPGDEKVEEGGCQPIS